MAPKKPPIEGAVSPAEALRFAAVAEDVLRRPLYTPRKHTDADAPPLPHIGTLREKRLHAAVKLYLCPDESRHERPAAEFLTDKTVDPRRMVADIYDDGDIYEVQTGGFFPLRDKVAWYLAHTAARVTVVHPMAAVRYLSRVDPATGDVISRRRTAGRGRVRDVARELYWLSDFIGDPRFTLRLLLLEIEEYRLDDGSCRGRRGSRYERFPTALHGDVTLREPADYAAYFLPVALPSSFTAADYTRATGIRGKSAYSMVHLLEKLELVRESEERVGRARGYEVIERTANGGPYDVR